MRDRRIVVTGGAGHLGRVLCAGLADAGADVFCISSKQGEFPTHRGIRSLVGDVGDEAWFASVVWGFRPIHGLLHCAGRTPRHADLDMPSEAFMGGLESAVGVAFSCARTCSRLMAEGGSIVILASMWGILAPTPAVYLGMNNDPSFAGSAAAGAILSLTRHMASELAPRTRVNALVPGWFPKRSGPDNPVYMHEIESRVPMGRIGQPEDLIGPAAFLLSGASAYVTGQALCVDGGYSIR